ncbi:MAG: OmpA family protein [gamma proteobacterium endosymbiont of Lamellibrachia anaximandri]|nr:OmpA family protein [gamma proteobacterium endosymbiont of Lamellibrachia anaximandri]MBL3618010.1 OmpA family protein [gamma proteobacterium endosymbiont of Lamellibrachia anaximandri]
MITEQLIPITGDEESPGNKLPSVDLAVEFEHNSARLTEHARTLLGNLAKSLLDPRFSKTVFGIHGHSDASGQSEYNLQLSEKRARSVAKYLVNSLGIVSEMLITRGFGETQLKFPQDPYSKANRRVEIVNLTPNLIKAPESPSRPLHQIPSSSHQSIIE